MELKELIKQQKAKGVLVKALAHPSLVIMAQDCGMDFILYDCEHGVLSYEQLHDLMVLGNMRKLSSAFIHRQSCTAGKIRCIQNSGLRCSRCDGAYD